MSWFVQSDRFGDPRNGLMISQYASLGNHAHSNGVAMELYGKGYILIELLRKTLSRILFAVPRAQYRYGRRNPEMLSNHPFDLLACYPTPEQKDGYYHGITYSSVYFLEPESRSGQNRLLGSPHG